MAKNGSIWKNPIFTLFGIVFFFACSLIAMTFYAGGTLTDPTTIGYAFDLNKFSDLGMWKTYGGSDNFISFFLFNLSLIVVGLSIIPFSLVFYDTYRDITKNLVLLKIGKWAGIGAGICFAGVGLTPRDLLLVLHHLTQYIAFFLIFIMCILYGLTTFKVHDKKEALLFWLCAIFQFLYLLILFHIIPTSRLIDCISQKIIVYIQLIVIGLESFFLVQFYSKN